MNTPINSILQLVLAALSGCAVTAADCDPANRDASILRKGACLNSGTYDERVHTLELELDEKKSLNVMFRNVYAAVEKEKSEVRGQLKRERREHGELDRSLNALLDELQAKTGGNQEIKRKIAGLRQELASVKDDKSQAVVEKQVKLDELKGKVKDLESALGLH